MTFSELIQTYFERSVALQWYWTVYVLVIGGVLGFSTFRQRPELLTTVLITILYLCFAYKNLGAIEATAEEREAVRQAAAEYSVSGPNADNIRGAWEKLGPKMPEYDIAGARYFHVACDLLAIAYIWVKEWRRRKPEPLAAVAAR